MKENLNKNVITVLIIEILAFILSAILNLIDSPLLVFMTLAVLLINVSAIIILFIHKPKHYLLTSFIALSIFLSPLLFLAYVISNVHC